MVIHQNISRIVALIAQLEQESFDIQRAAGLVEFLDYEKGLAVQCQAVGWGTANFLYHLNPELPVFSFTVATREEGRNGWENLRAEFFVNAPEDAVVAAIEEYCAVAKRNREAQISH